MRGPAAGVALWLLLVAPARSSTVAEQRARLPPPSACEDPVAGTWRSHTYDLRRTQWTEFTLTIRRVPGDPTALTGQIVNHSWYGDEAEVQPGPCEGRMRYVVSMDAVGELSPTDDLRFDAVGEWRLDRMLCGDFTNVEYYLDHFTGRIDRTLQEFQSVNNDGMIAFDEPTVFRRIACEDRPPLVAPSPPPFQPPARGCWK